MPRGRKDIYKDAKGFDKNPQNINRSGANRKTWTSVNKDLASKGIEQVTRDTYYETAGRLMNGTQAELRAITEDESMPQWLRWMIADLSNKKIRAKLMSEYRDWMFGKAKQDVNIDLSIGQDVDEVWD